SVRLDRGSVHVLDLLVGTGIAKSRSEATARLVQIGISASGKLLERAREVANLAHLLREEFSSPDDVIGAPSEETSGVGLQESVARDGRRDDTSDHKRDEKNGEKTW